MKKLGFGRPRLEVFRKYLEIEIRVIKKLRPHFLIPDWGDKVDNIMP
jgi:hypothetical protein